MKENGSKVLKAGVWYTVCSFLIKGMAFLTTPIFTRLLSKGEIGDFATLGSWISILSVVVTLNLANSVPLARYDYKKNFDGFISSITLFSISCTFLFSTIVFVFRNYISTFVGLPVYALYIVIIYLIVSPGMEILQAKLRIEMQYKPTVIMTFISFCTSLLLALLLVVSLEDGFFARSIGHYLPIIIIDFLISVSLIIRGKELSIEYCKYALVISLPLVIHHLSSNIMHSSDRIMIQKFCDSESVALYSVAYSGALIVNLIRNSMESAWDPWVFEMMNKERGFEIKRYSYPYITLFSLLCIGLVSVAPEALMLMGGNSYREAMYVIPPVVLAYYCSMIYSLYGGLERYHKKQKIFPFIGGTCALINVALNYVVIPTFGYIAAAYTTLISCFLEMLLHYLYSRKKGYSKVYSTPFNLLCIVLMAIICLIMMSLYSLLVIRYALIVIIIILLLIIALKNKQTVIKYMSRFSR